MIIISFIIIFFILRAASSSSSSNTTTTTTTTTAIPAAATVEYEFQQPSFFPRLLFRNEKYLLIGGKNTVFNISIINNNLLREKRKRRITWKAKDNDITTCINKGKLPYQCENYIRVLVKYNDSSMLICGTNAYNPICKKKYLNNNTTIEMSGKGICPFDPSQNYTFLRANDGQLYAGTIANFQGTMALIHKTPWLITNAEHLNEPVNFVHSFEFGDYVFFFFRETAVECIQCGKRVFSRIARVHKTVNNNNNNNNKKKISYWTSFLKKKLNCSISGGDYPFSFDYIQSVTNPIFLEHDDDYVIYATFTSIHGSAVCSFSMKTITNIFTTTNQSHTIAVPFSKLIIKKKDCFFTQIQVDSNVRIINLLNGIAKMTKVNVLFISTNTGIIYKVTSSLKYHYITEEIKLFKKPKAIIDLSLYDKTLISVTDKSIISVPIHRCQKVDTCLACVQLRDPYCAWWHRNDSSSSSSSDGVCTFVNSSNIVELIKGGKPVFNIFFQNITGGYHTKCPLPPPVLSSLLTRAVAIEKKKDVKKKSNYTTNTVINNNNNNKNIPPIYYFISTSWVAVSVILGFVTGFFIADKIAVYNYHNNNNSPSSSSSSFVYTPTVRRIRNNNINRGERRRRMLTL